MEGTFTSLGDFGECLELKDFNYTQVTVEGHLIIESQHPFIDGQTNNVTQLQSILGTCVPLLCANENDIKAIFKKAFDQLQDLIPQSDNFVTRVSRMFSPTLSLLVSGDQNLKVAYAVKSVHPFEGRRITGSVIAMACVWGLLLAMVLVSTLLDYYRVTRCFDIDYAAQKKKELDSIMSAIDIEDDTAFVSSLDVSVEQEVLLLHKRTAKRPVS